MGSVSATLINSLILPCRLSDGACYSGASCMNLVSALILHEEGTHATDRWVLTPERVLVGSATQEDNFV